MRKFAIVLLAVIAILVAISFGKDMLVKAAVEKGVEAVTGLKLTIQSIHLSIVRNAVSIKELKLYNPSSFQDRLMADVPEIYVECDLGAIMKGDIHIRSLRLNLAEFNVIKDKNGALNLNAFKRAGSPATEAKEGKKAVQAPKIRIDDLRLKAGRVVYKDYSAGSVPTVKEFNVNLDEQYSNVDNPYELIGIIISRTLMNTTISNLANIDITQLTGSISGSPVSVQKIASVVSAVTGGNLSSASQQAQGAVADTGKTVQDAAQKVQDIFKSPFGSQK